MPGGAGRSRWSGELLACVLVWPPCTVMVCCGSYFCVCWADLGMRAQPRVPPALLSGGSDVRRASSALVCVKVQVWPISVGEGPVQFAPWAAEDSHNSSHQWPNGRRLITFSPSGRPNRAGSSRSLKRQAPTSAGRSEQPTVSSRLRAGGSGQDVQPPGGRSRCWTADSRSAWCARTHLCRSAALVCGLWPRSSFRDLICCPCSCGRAGSAAGDLGGSLPGRAPILRVEGSGRAPGCD